MIMSFVYDPREEYAAVGVRERWVKAHAMITAEIKVTFYYPIFQGVGLRIR